MCKQWMAAGLVVVAGLTQVSAQTKKPAPSGVIYDVTITADGAAYTGTMALVVKGGKVTGKMHITKPTEITGDVAGTAKAGAMLLDFPYEMVQRKCQGQIAMDVKPAQKATPASGTVSIAGCGRDASNKLGGTIELKPAPRKS